MSELEECIGKLYKLLIKNKIIFDQSIIPDHLRMLTIPDRLLQFVPYSTPLQPHLEVPEARYRPETTFVDGTKYLGQWLNEKRHGKGQAYNGYAYMRGYWKNDDFINGIITNNDFSEYQGNVEKGKYVGKGRLISQNSKYIGEFKNNLYEGEGELILDGHLIYMGKFLGGFCVNGRLECIDPTNQYIYIGEFSKNLKHGKGMLSRKNGEYYQGSYREDLQHGHGIEKRNDQIFEGEWIKGKLNGKVKMRMNGATYFCKFEDNIEDEQERVLIKE